MLLHLHTAVMFAAHLTLRCHVIASPKMSLFGTVYSVFSLNFGCRAFGASLTLMTYENKISSVVVALSIAAWFPERFVTFMLISVLLQVAISPPSVWTSRFVRWKSTGRKSSCRFGIQRDRRDSGRSPPREWRITPMLPPISVEF